MRILALAHAYIPGQNAGAECMLHGMLAALANSGHQVSVSLSSQTGRPYEIDGVAVRPYQGKQDVFELLGDADVIVTHLENSMRAGILGRLNSIPVITILHNTMSITRSWLRREPPALAVANSEWMAADYRRWFATQECEPPPMMVCRPPVDPGAYATTPGDRITLVNLRRLEGEHDGAIGKGSEVFWELARHMRKTRFLGVTGGYGVQDIRSGFRNVEILPNLTHDQMRERVYARTRILLCPSSYESWGRVAAEAMASGIPVIAHPTPGLTECLGPAGIFADRRDIGAWITAIGRLSRKDEYERASRRALERSAQLHPAADLATWVAAVEDVHERHQHRLRARRWQPALV